MKIQSLGLNLLPRRKADHHIVDDVVVLGQRVVAWAEYTLVGTDNWVVGHVIHLCIDILFLIATSEKKFAILFYWNLPDFF